MLIPFPGTASDQDGDVAAGGCHALARALELSRHMLALAHEGDWDAVARCESQRRSYLAGALDAGHDTRHGELIADALAAILQLNEELVSLLGEARLQLSRAGSQQRRSLRAVDTYAANATPSR
jgi:hypothetical protein